MVAASSSSNHASLYLTNGDHFPDLLRAAFLEHDSCTIIVSSRIKKSEMPVILQVGECGWLAAHHT